MNRNEELKSIAETIDKFLAPGIDTFSQKEMVKLMLESQSRMCKALIVAKSKIKE